MDEQRDERSAEEKRKKPMDPGTEPNVANENLADDRPVTSDADDTDTRARGRFVNRPGAGPERRRD